jgi:hypothetical protein
MNDDNRTIQELAQNALDCQDACNLSGVVHSFSRDITRLRTLLNAELGEKFSTTKLNQHPICQLYVDKMRDLSGFYFAETDGAHFSRAYNWCKENAK